MGFWDSSDPPEQPSYGEATAETIQAQIDAMPKILANLGTERELREGYQDLETDLLTRQLLGEIKRTDEQGRYVSGQRYLDAAGQEVADYQQVTDESDRGRLWLQARPDLKAAFDNNGMGQGDTERAAIARIKAEGGTAEDFANWHRGLAQTGHYGNDEQRRANSVPEVGAYYNPASIQSGVFHDDISDTLTSEDVYSIKTDEEGNVLANAIYDREGGALDLYGGDTKVRQFDQAKYQENLDSGMSEEEAREAATTWGTAGFDPETGEFKGLIPMMQEAQAYIASQQRESDISDVEALGDRATAAIRSQGSTQEVLDDIARQVSSNEAAVDPLRKQLLTRANELANAQLSDREKQQLEQLIRARRQAAGRNLREYGATYDEVKTVMEEDWNRGMQGALAGGQLMAGESAMQTNLLGQQMTRLGAEQATSSDPFMAILGRPSQSAPGAQSLLSTGAGLMGESGSMINSESGLPYISNQYTNQANMYAADQAATGSMVGGLLQGLGSLGGDWFKFGKKKTT